MPRRNKGPRLWLRSERRRNGKVIAKTTFIILDAGKHIATGCSGSEAEAAERALAAYIQDKYRPSRKERDIEEIDVADVLSIYFDDTSLRQANVPKLQERIVRLNDFWGGRSLAQVNGETCREYVRWRGTDGGARRDLEDLRAAINHHAKEGSHRGRVRVWLPPKGLPRERWLTRDEAARLLWHCWRAREVQTIHRGTRKGQTVITSKRPLRHLARFVLIGLYTGTRAGAIATASPMRLAGRSFVDLEQGVYYRLAVGKRATAKRQPAVPLPARLLAHLRRWQRLGIAREYFVEWNGKAVRSVKTAFGSAVAAIELDGRVTPHTLRHTAATWLMQAGVPLWQAAGFLGMSEKLLEQTYGHHHPDHLREAAQKMGYGNRRPAGAGKPETLVVSLADERAKRTPTGQVIENAGGGRSHLRTVL